MEITPSGQVFFTHEADRLHRYCTCPDRSGSCAWCHVYYHGPDEHGLPIQIVAKDDGLWFSIPNAAINLSQGHGPIVEQHIKEFWTWLRGTKATES